MTPSSRPSAIIADEGRVVVRSLTVLAVVVVCGTLGFMLTERHWSVWQAFYFTLITITTVGYGDL